MKRSRFGISVLVAATLALAACGSEDSGGEGTATTAPTETTAAETTAAETTAAGTTAAQTTAAATTAAATTAAPATTVAGGAATTAAGGAATTARPVATTAGGGAATTAGGAATTAAPATTAAGPITINNNPDNGVTATAIRVGWMGDATGPTASSQGLNLQGMQAYFDWFNAQGGIGGKRLELIVKDDKFVADTAAINFRQLVNDDKVLAILGMGNSAITSALARQVNDARIPVIGPPQTIDPQIESPYFFNSLIATTEQSQLAIQRLAQRATNGNVAQLKVAIVQLNVPSGDEWNQFVKENLERQGGQYMGRVVMTSTQPDASATVVEVRRLLDQGANAIAFHGSPATALLFLNEMDKQGLTNIPIVGIHGLAVTSIYTQGPPSMRAQVEGIQSFLPVSENFPVAATIRDAIRNNPSWQAAALTPNFTQGWLNGMVLTQAITRAARDNNGNVNRETLTRALRGTFDTGGITCPLDYTRTQYTPCGTIFGFDPATSTLKPLNPFTAYTYRPR